MGKHEFTKEEIAGMSALELLRLGFDNLDQQNEETLKEQLRSTKDEHERKQLERRLEDLESYKSQEGQKPAETQAEAMERQMKQQQENDKIKQQIKRYVVDGRTGELVEVTKNIETNGHKK